MTGIIWKWCFSKVPIRYHHVEGVEKNEIINVLERAEDDKSVVESVLAAIYHHDTEFAGGILLEAIRTAPVSRWLNLARMIGTFMQMHRTAYLAHAFLAEVRNASGLADDQPEISELVEAVNEFQQMFGTH